MLILFNKPFNVLCQFTDKDDRKNLSDFIDVKNIYAAGRLDYDSEGLVVLTDDGKLQNHISDPKSKLEKTYWVQVEGVPTEESLIKIRKGILLKDGITKPAKVKIINA
ncbi:MAG: pseudouridine synthase, partial [Ignavibacteriaceae bacterium]|nr:pseudouridine synthase [Ignavibacteriaceae bacterium]